MTRHTAAGWALIIGTLAGLLTMATHPTGRDVIVNAASGGHNILAMAGHGLAIAAQPLLLAGLLALTALLARRHERLAYTAFIAYAFGAMAIIVAAIASGFILPALVVDLANANDTLRDVIHAQMHFANVINQSFAKVSVVASCTAILLWSIAMWRSQPFSKWMAG